MFDVMEIKNFHTVSHKNIFLTRNARQKQNNHQDEGLGS